MQLKDSRLKLEVEVANENALHWQEELRKANERNAELRMLFNRARDVMRRVVTYGVPAVLRNDINKILSGE